MKNLSKSSNLSSALIVFLVLLRMAIGWHFLYEGLAKLATPGWSAEGYLLNSTWILGGIFHWMATTPSILAIVNFLNVWGLILIGLGLMLGLFTRVAAIAGTALLLMYYFAYPPFIHTFQPTGGQAIFMIVNLNLIEAFALLALASTNLSRKYGLDYFIPRLKKRADKPAPGLPEPVAEPAGDESSSNKRREMLKALVSLPVAGAFAYSFHEKHGWPVYEEKNLKVNGVSGATGKPLNFKDLDELKGKIPVTKIKDLEVSRMIMGGNLIGGWAHSRDLIYVSDLVKAYHSEEKIFSTLNMAEQCGINSIITNPILLPTIRKYWDHGGKIQFISDGGWSFKADIQKSIDQGAAACYIQGGTADNLVKEEKYDDIAWALDTIRKNGLPAGIGAHELPTVKACVERGLIPDFWMKTFHKNNYWSARIDHERKTTLDEGFADNIFCQSSDDVAAYMESLEQPWIAFKILAAGAIKPKDAFRWAFENGADFICVGMYDFQMVDNVNLAHEILSEDIVRRRPWRA